MNSYLRKPSVSGCQATLMAAGFSLYDSKSWCGMSFTSGRSSHLKMFGY